MFKVMAAPTGMALTGRKTRTGETAAPEYEAWNVNELNETEEVVAASIDPENTGYDAVASEEVITEMPITPGVAGPIVSPVSVTVKKVPEGIAVNDVVITTAVAPVALLFRPLI